MLSEALSCLRFYSYNAVVKLEGSLSSNTIIIINENIDENNQNIQVTQDLNTLRLEQVQQNVFELLYVRKTIFSIKKRG